MGPISFAKIRRDEGVSDATHREVWVNYTCPSSILCLRAELFSVEVIDGRMRPGDLQLSLRGVLIHGEKMGNNGIIPRKRAISAAWSAPKVQTLLPNLKRPEGLNKNFRSYRPSYNRGGCRTWNIARVGPGVSVAHGLSSVGRAFTVAQSEDRCGGLRQVGRIFYLCASSTSRLHFCRCT